MSSPIAIRGIRLTPLASLLLSSVLFSSLLLASSTLRSGGSSASNGALAALGRARQSTCCGQPGEVSLRQLDFPYYKLTDGYQSTLFLVSDSGGPIDLTLVVRSSLGDMVTTLETIQPGQKLSFDLATLIAQLGGDPAGEYAEGSVAVYYQGTIMPVVGQISVRNPQLRLEDESEMVENDPGRSDIPAVLNGAWWGLTPTRQAKVMVSNTSGAPVTAQVSLDLAGQQDVLPTPLAFLPYATKVLDIAQLLDSIGVDPATAPQGGITIRQVTPDPASSPALIANGKITDEARGFSSTIYFPSPALENAAAVHASGLPVGFPSADSPYAGIGNFVPHAVVRNLLGTPQTVTVTLEYPTPPPPTAADTPAPPPATGNTPPKRPLGDKTNHPEWGVGLGGATATLTAATVSLGAFSTQDLSLDSAMSQLPGPVPYVSIRIQYSGAPGSVVSHVFSLDATRDLVVDAMVQNEGNGWASSGGNPWHLDSDTESVVFLTNESDQPARIGCSVTANGVTYYLTMLVLAPHETRAIDIRALRDAQIADFKGNKIPAAASDGSILWNRLDNVPVMGRLCVIQRHNGMTATYDCCYCPCPDYFQAIVGIFDSNYNMVGNTNTQPQVIAVQQGGSLQLTAYGYYKSCNEGNYYFNWVANSYRGGTGAQPNISWNVIQRVGGDSGQ